MKVVIAGGSGRLGRAISAALLDRGDEVVVLSRGGGSDPRIPTAVRVVTWAPPELGDWVDELAGADAVINLAGESLAR
jgi:nucleoside-diphosphate-sugar epimerase